MSHFTTVKVGFSDADVLKSALEVLGYNDIAFDSDVRGYQGNTRKADIVVRCTNGYDIGFVKGKDGNYTMVADWWGVRQNPEAFLQPLNVEYSRQAIRQAAARFGFEIETEEKVGNNGELRLVLGRWS